jgi:hypothetical protein
MINKTDNKFIVYAHLNGVTNEVFYIGIGVKGREKQKLKRSERWINYVNKYGFTVIVLKVCLMWDDACRIEKRLIHLIGRKDTNSGTLINMTNGGDGTGGYEGYWKGKKRPPASNETIEKCKKNSSRHWLGKKHSDETRRKIGLIQIGKKLSEEHKRKLSGKIPWNKGKKGVQPSTRKGIKQKPMTEETKFKISSANKGQKRSAEFCQKLGNIHRGKVISMEVREKVSLGLKKYYNERK